MTAAWMTRMVDLSKTFPRPYMVTLPNFMDVKRYERTYGGYNFGGRGGALEPPPGKRVLSPSIVTFVS